MSRTFGRRINAWLAEPKGEQFRDNKWRFWFVALIGFSIVNAALTALVFNAGGVLQTYMGTVLVGVGALLAWLGVGALHYSDSTDTHLSRGVAVLDSVTLLFVVAHFSFLMWGYGHLSTLKNAEADYKVAIATYNAEARAVQSGNEKIAEALAKVADAEAKRARIENDTVYQARKAAQAGARVQTGRGAKSLAGNISTSPVELAKPPEPPKDSSADYLTRWDSTIRLANFGELALAIFTLIFIRVRSSLTNSPGETYHEEEFPDEIETEDRLPIKRGKFTQKKETAKKHASFDSEGLRRIREALRDISFRLPGLSFKSYVRGDAVWILMVRANQGTQETVSSAKAKLSILDDAMRMERTAFRERLENFLRENDFELE
jgi:hypothetical protein